MFTDYEEVHNYYLDENDGFYRIDAWEKGKDEGQVVAYVHAKTGDAVISEPLAHLSGMVKEAIESLQKEIRKTKAEEVSDGYACVHLAVDGRYDVFVPMDSVEKMKESAMQKWYEADFGDLHEADMKIVYIQDPEGNYVYEI